MMQYIDELITRIVYKCATISPSGGGVSSSITADSSEVTADSTEITVDAT